MMNRFVNTPEYYLYDSWVLCTFPPASMLAVRFIMCIMHAMMQLHIRGETH